MLEKTNAFFKKFKESNDDDDPLLKIDFNNDINATNAVGNTIFYIACGHQEVEVVKELLAVEGIDIFKRNNSGESPLVMTIYYAVNSRDADKAYQIIKMITDHPDFLLAERAITDIKVNQGENHE